MRIREFRDREWEELIVSLSPCTIAMMMRCQNCGMTGWVGGDPCSACVGIPEVWHIPPLPIAFRVLRFLSGLVRAVASYVR